MAIKYDSEGGFLRKLLFMTRILQETPPSTVPNALASCTRRPPNDLRTGPYILGLDINPTTTTQLNSLTWHLANREWIPQNSLTLNFSERIPFLPCQRCTLRPWFGIYTTLEIITWLHYRHALLSHGQLHTTRMIIKYLPLPTLAFSSRALSLSSMPRTYIT